MGTKQWHRIRREKNCKKNRSELFSFCHQRNVKMNYEWINQAVVHKSLHHSYRPYIYVAKRKTYIFTTERTNDSQRKPCFVWVLVLILANCDIHTLFCNLFNWALFGCFLFYFCLLFCVWTIAQTYYVWFHICHRDRLYRIPFHSTVFLWFPTFLRL